MIEVQHVSKIFSGSESKALDDINFTVESGDFVSIWGRSGSGKTTLLYVLSTLDLPSQGKVLIDGQDWSQMSVDTVHQLRNRSIGFIFQFHYLLPELSALENILLPSHREGRKTELLPRARDLMKACGLSGKENRLSSQLSGGEQQRVAIARSLCMNPRYIFADEPTGNLDTRNGEMVMGLLREVNQQGTTVILVTHDKEFASTARRQIVLVDGRLSNS